MCGIAGIIGSFSKEEGSILLREMLITLTHRGPDASGSWVADGYALGMQRLSIIDLETGNQPIWSDDGVCIIFNGEIYNFKKLRTQLITNGFDFKTSGDTEVILQMYRWKGLEALQYLEGMFAICLYDTRVNKIYLIRDRLGIKPLYYFVHEGQFIFASEIKSILATFDTKPALNTQAIWDQLTLRYVPGPQTIWLGINRLEPGNYLELNLESWKIDLVRFWSIRFQSANIDRARDYNREFSDLFMEAVNKRLLAADVPVGILLSGGLDSSCVAAAARELGHRNFHTFSIGYDENEQQFNELHYAREVAEYVGSNHHEIIITREEFTEFLDDFVWYSDEPLADLASIPLYFVSKLAAKHVKVVLSGEGADEVLSGYDLDNLSRKLFKLKILDYLPNSVLKKLPFDSCKVLAKYGHAKFMHHTSMHITNAFSEDEKRQLCRFQGERSTDLYIKNLYKLSPSSQPLDQLQQAYCHSWLVEDLLMKADRMSMAASLELRVPFLDHKLVEWAAKLPLRWKVGNMLSGFTTKKILRSFANNRLPIGIINRPKQGFPVPAYKWLQNELLDYAKRRLNTDQINQYFYADRIQSLFTQLAHDPDTASHKVWNLLILSIWLQRWLP